MAKTKTKIAETPKPRVSFPLVILPKSNTRHSLPLYKMAKEAAESIYAPTRKPLYDLYDEITLDTHLSSVIDKRVLAITNVGWAFTVEGQPVEALSDFLGSITFSKMLTHIIESRFYGHSLIEVLDIIGRDIELVPRPYVSPIHQMVIPDPFITTQGYDYSRPPFSNTCFEAGDPEDLGLLYKVAPYVIMKKADISDWASYNEVFGSPLRIGKYDPNIPGNEAAVAGSLGKMGNLAYAAIPIGSEFEFIESNKSGSGNTIYEQFANYCNKEISKAIVGQTMTTEDGGSLSQAKVHMEVQKDLNLADRSFVEKILNERFLPILQNFISVPPGARFHVIEEDETLTKKERLEIDLKLHKEVAPIETEYFEKEYNVPFQARTLSKEVTELRPLSEVEVRSGRSVKKNFFDFFRKAPTR